MSKIIRYTPNSNIPNKSQQDELNALAEMSDVEIDTSDIAPLEAEWFKVAEQNPFYKPIKMPTTIRLDADVLAWLKSKGKGYQTKINRILREAMIQELNSK